MSLLPPVTAHLLNVEGAESEGGERLESGLEPKRLHDDDELDHRLSAPSAEPALSEARLVETREKGISVRVSCRKGGLDASREVRIWRKARTDGEERAVKPRSTK